MNQTKVIVTVMLFLASSGGLIAQKVVAASGGDASGTGGTFSFTIGQIDYTSNSGSNGEVNQGVQQAFEIVTTVGIENKDIVLDISTYPNPSSESITIKLGEQAHENLDYQLFDIQGKLIESTSIEQKETHIAMDQLAPAAYLLKITSNGKLVKEFKIIKN